MINLVFDVMRNIDIKIREKLGIIESNRNNDYKRLDEDLYYIYMCYLVSKRSHDSQTQCGCVLVKNGIPIMMGYNGFLRGSDDNSLPNLRPAKYAFIVHSEANAIINAARVGISVDGATAYITGVPCPECAKKLIQADIKDWVYAKSKNEHSTAAQEADFLNFLIKSYQVKVRIVEIDQRKIDLIKSL